MEPVRARCERLILGESGQMAVELAVMIPVVVVVALVVYNLGCFICLCATFDRVSLDACLSQGVAGPGSNGIVSAQEEVRSCIEEAMDTPSSCSVEVASRIGLGSGTDLLSLSPVLTRYHCVLVFRPWPSRFVIAGVPLRAPVTLRHEREIVVDRFRTGVVV